MLSFHQIIEELTLNMNTAGHVSHSLSGEGARTAGWRAWEVQLKGIDFTFVAAPRSKTTNNLAAHLKKRLQ